MNKPHMSRRRLVAVLFASLALLLLSLQDGQPALADPGGLKTDKIDKALLAEMKANPRGKFDIIVHTNPAGAKTQRDDNSNQEQQGNNSGNNSDRVQKAVERLKLQGANRGHRLAIVGGATATVSYDAIAGLSHDPFVGRISLDQKLTSLGNPALGLQSLYTQIVNAPSVWAQGDTGQGIGVAILDSGIALADDLVLPTARIVASVDFTNAPAAGDPGGHGTHVAGIVGGNGTASLGAWKGVAPSVNLVNVRVIESNGSASLSAVLRGIQWVIQNRRTYNIKVMNLSLGAPALHSYRDDLLSAAVEMAWNSGIVVVVAAGNAGPGAGTVLTPGIDPYVITVGALDDNGTLTTADDTVAFFSSQGPTPDGMVKPDVVAPGRKIVSLRVPGSFLDLLMPDRITDGTYFRLSGTSMAAPVVAGTAALLLQHQPGLRPNQVKYALMQTAHPIPGIVNPNATGAGLIDAYAAVNSIVYGRANRGLTPSDGFCLTVYTMLKGMPMTGIWRDPHYKNITWDNITWDNITWDRTTWENINWDNITWDTISWDTATWVNITWDSATWD